MIKYCSIIVLCFCISLSVSIIVENPNIEKKFRLGYYSFISSVDSSHLHIPESCASVRNLNSGVLNSLFNSMRGWNLSMVAYTYVKFDWLNREALSFEINECTLKVPVKEKEVLYQLALALYPWNYVVMKNYAFQLEWDGHWQALNDLNYECMLLTKDAGCVLSYAISVPPIMWSMAQKPEIESLVTARLESVYSRIRYLKSLNDQQKLDETVFVRASSYYDIRELPMNLQYHGFRAHYFYSIWSAMLRLLYADLNQSYNVVPVKNAAVKGIRNALRFGIVSEFFSNSSPLLCLGPILSRVLDSMRRNKNTPIHFVYFPRKCEIEYNELPYEILLRRLADEVVFIECFDVHSAASSIRASDIDILLYLSLPTEKLTYFAAHLRLAKIQVHYGLGHPIGPGIGQTIDYRIVSSLMQENMLSNFDFGVNTFLEQPHHVLFDSLAYYLTDPLSTNILAEPSFVDGVKDDIAIAHVHNDPLEYVAKHMECDEIDRFLYGWGAYPNVTAARIYKRCRTEDWGMEDARLYYAIQFPKKLQPVFDHVLFGIIQRDPNAIIILSAQVLGLVERWLYSEEMKYFGITEELIYRHFVFIPRVSRPHNLILLSMSHVFLNTFPFGAGITSSEALATCLPVLLLVEPVETASKIINEEMLYFALAQVRVLGSDVYDILAANSVQDYVERAVGIAMNTINIRNNQVFYEENINPHWVRSLVCERKDMLFGQHQLDAAVNEWRRFLVRLYRGLD